MPDTGPGGHRSYDGLAALALLYACGEMDEPAAAAFERRLGEDQAAREALCQAVELNRDLAGLAALAPDPAYRGRVRRRLLSPSDAHRGHPALWAATGAAAA